MLAIQGQRRAGIAARAAKWAQEAYKSQEDWEHGFLSGSTYCRDHWVPEIPENYQQELVISATSRFGSFGSYTTGIEKRFQETSFRFREGYIAALKQHVADQRPCYLQIAKLGYWIGLAKSVAMALWESGQDFTEVRSLKTEFINWEVGGTYRHKVLLAGAHMPSQKGGHYRPGLIGDLFGRGRSKSGVIDTPEGVLVYQDQ